MDARRYLKQNDRDWVSQKYPKKTTKSGKPWRERIRYALISCFWLLLGCAVGSTIWTLPLIAEWLNRPIARVGISGTIQYINRSQLQQQLMPLVSQTFFQTDLAVIQRSLQDHSWVYRAEVRKIWPDVVEIELEEEVPIARWFDTDMINARGEILESWLGQDFSALPVLGGPAGREQEVMQQYQTLSHHLRPLGLQVVGVNLSLSGKWSFTAGHVEIALGGKDLIERMQHFTRLYYGLLQSRWQQVESVDLRYRDGAAVAWRKRIGVADNNS